MEKVVKDMEKAIRENDLFQFLKAALECRKKTKTGPKDDAGSDEIQEMIDYILANTKSNSVISFIGGVNVFKRTMRLSSSQINCVKNTYIGLKEIERMHQSSEQGSLI